METYPSKAMTSRQFVVLLACVNGCARGVQAVRTRDVHVALSAANSSGETEFTDILGRVLGRDFGRLVGHRAAGMPDETVFKFDRDSEVEPAFCVNRYEEHYAWRTMPQDPADVKLNICAEGKQLPEFYLLGPPKCGTTSLSLDLMATGIGTLGFDYRAESQTRANTKICSKELHYFDFQMKREKLSLEEARQEWLAQMPTCQHERRVLADFSPSNLRWVPAPEGFNTQESRAHANLPPILHDWYGPHASAITFAVMLRKPLDRLHSSWHHAGKSKRSDVSEFQAAMEELMRDASDSGTYGGSGTMWGVLYSLHLKAWMDHFSASQFVLIPFRKYVAGDKDSVCRAISRTMRYQMMCDSDGRPAAEAKHHEGPSLDDEATSEFQARFDKFMETETGRLVDLLVSMHSQGAALPGYSGPGGDKAAVRAWLLDNW